VKLPDRIAALEGGTPYHTAPMARADALALWAEMEVELAESDLYPVGITAHHAWANYRDCLNA
jgi:hypothetical protein